MATVKIFTSLEQSKKLAEIIPLESADMYYEEVCNLPKAIVENYILHNQCMEDKDYKKLSNPVLSPAWSLASLLNLLPNEISTGERYCDKYQIDIRKYDGGDNTTLYQIAYGNNRGISGSWHDMINTSEKESAIDACYEMILNLNELNLL